MSAAGSAGHSRVIRSTTHDKAGIGSQAVLDHSVHTIAGEGGTCNAVYLQFVLGGTALHHSKVDRLATGLCKERASVEQFLEAALADACAQTCSFALMIEIGTIDRLLVLVEGDVAPEAAPKATARDGNHILHAILSLCHKHVQDALLDEAAIGAVESAFIGNQLGAVPHHVLHLLAEGSRHVDAVDVDIEGSEDLPLGIILHIGILDGLERAGNKSQQESHNHHHDGGIYDGVDIAVSVETLLGRCATAFGYFLKLRGRSLAYGALFGSLVSLVDIATYLTFKFLCSHNPYFLIARRARLLILLCTKQ